MQKTVNPNQLNLLIPTESGYEPYDKVNFCGTDYEPKRDKVRLNTKFNKVFKIIKNWGKFTNMELYRITNPLGINDDTASRCVRKIGEIRYMGYFVVKDKKANPITFRCIKL